MLLEVVFLKKIQNFKINKKILKKEKEKRKPKLNRVQVQVTELSQEDAGNGFGREKEKGMAVFQGYTKYKG